MSAVCENLRHDYGKKTAVALIALPDEAAIHYLSSVRHTLLQGTQIAGSGAQPLGHSLSLTASINNNGSLCSAEDLQERLCDPYFYGFWESPSRSLFCWRCFYKHNQCVHQK